MARLRDALTQIVRDPQTLSRFQQELASGPNRTERFVELANEIGFAIDPAEVQQAIAALPGELDDSALDAVSGGVQSGGAVAMEELLIAHEGLDVQMGYNPKEMGVDKSVPWLVAKLFRGG